MKIEKQVCRYEQALKLQQLGLKQQAAFYWVKTTAQQGHVNCSLFFGIEAACKQYNDWVRHDEFLTSKTETPVAAWNCAELGALLYTYKEIGHSFQNDANGQWAHTWRQHNYLKPIIGWYCSEATARAAMLLELLERKLLTIELLNQKLLIA
jgi:hypothetical protein